MAAPDQPTQMLARLYHYVWLATIALLAAAGAIYAIGQIVGISANTGMYFTQFSVQMYLVLVPMAIFVFATMMSLRKDWRLASTGYILTLIWIGAKILG